MKKLNLWNVLWVFLLIVISGCDDEKDSSFEKPVNIEGKVEKGPYVKGSVVTIHELSEELTQTGRSFQANILNDEGSFVVEDVTLTSPYVLLTATGYFFDEVKGDESDGSLTLQTIADLNDGTSVNVNIFSHLRRETDRTY